jgi:hypothetical protein
MAERTCCKVAERIIASKFAKNNRGRPPKIGGSGRLRTYSRDKYFGSRDERPKEIEGVGVGFNADASGKSTSTLHECISPDV